MIAAKSTSLFHFCLHNDEIVKLQKETVTTEKYQLVHIHLQMSDFTALNATKWSAPER